MEMPILSGSTHPTPPFIPSLVRTTFYHAPGILLIVESKPGEPSAFAYYHSMMPFKPTTIFFDDPVTFVYDLYNNLIGFLTFFPGGPGSGIEGEQIIKLIRNHAFDSPVTDDYWCTIFPQTKPKNALRNFFANHYTLAQRAFDYNKTILQRRSMQEYIRINNVICSFLRTGAEA